MALKRRWAAYRAAKGTGRRAVSQGSNRSKKAGRRGRPRKALNNPFLDMSISQLPLRFAPIRTTLFMTRLLV